MLMLKVIGIETFVYKLSAHKHHTKPCFIYYAEVSKQLYDYIAGIKSIDREKGISVTDSTEKIDGLAGILAYVALNLEGELELKPGSDRVPKEKKRFNVGNVVFEHEEITNQELEALKLAIQEWRLKYSSTIEIIRL